LLREIELPFPERRLNEYPHQYSGGMRQRVMIAIAMANNPDVLIADEPTTALDVTTQAHVLDLLEDLAEHHGTSIVLITHNFGVVAEFCESVLVMYAGRIVEQSSVEDIFVHPAHPYTEALLRSVPRPELAIDGDLPSIPGLPPNLATVSAGCSFEPRCPVGRGRQACIERPPLPPLSIEAHGRTVIAECHFARDRLSELTPAQVDG
jgi:oligopeptide/dipeptide ABC transporter ATP-binding protein